MSTEFYEALAEHYDELFGCSRAVTDFIRSHGPAPGAHVLDIACGTGACARALCAEGYDTWGIDLSERMIARARELARDAGQDSSRYAVMDMLEVDAHPAAPFGLAICIGNSIAHLRDRVALNRFAHAAAGALRRTGDEPPRSLVVQFVDVSSLAVGQMTELPILTGARTTMERVYTRTSVQEISFDARIETLSENGVRAAQTVSQRLLVLDESTVRGALEDAGFSRIKSYAGFQNDASTGWARVLVARV